RPFGTRPEAPERRISMTRRPKRNAPTHRPAEPVSLAGVLAALERDGKLTATRQRDLISAGERGAVLLGDEPAALPLDITAISARLAAVNPAAGGPRSHSLADIKSHLL